jgi:hypothetical protein
MALYFFSLSDDVMFYHSGEDLPNDVAAVAHAALVATEIGMNKPLGWQADPRIYVFNAQGKRVA